MNGIGFGFHDMQTVWFEQTQRHGILKTHASETKYNFLFENPAGMELPPNPCFGSVELLRAIPLIMAKAILKFYFEILRRGRYVEFSHL